MSPTTIVGRWEDLQAHGSEFTGRIVKLIVMPDSAPSSGGGLLAAVGALAEIDDLDAILSDIQTQRACASDRETELE